MGDFIALALKQKAGELFPDMRAVEAFSKSPIFSGISRDFADSVFQSLADLTVKFSTKDPQNAEAYKEAGFTVLWRKIKKKYFLRDFIS